MTHPTFTCPVCEQTSYHPGDAAEGYCGNCHAWTGGQVPFFARTFVVPAFLPEHLNPAGLVVRVMAGCGATLVPITPIDLDTDNEAQAERHSQAATAHLSTCDCHLVLLVINDGDTGGLTVLGHVDTYPEEMT